MGKNKPEIKKQIRLLLTSSRGYINLGRIESLRNNSQYDFYIVGVDIFGDKYKLPILDEQIQIPAGNEKKYIGMIRKITTEKMIDVILPASDVEVEIISKNKKLLEKMGVGTVCSSYSVTHSAVNKASMLLFLKEKKIDVPKFFIPKSIRELILAAKKLGYPKKPLIVKPAFASGNRGVWLIKENFSKELLHSRGIPHISIDEFVKQVGKLKHFPKIVLMEYLSGDEYSVDGLSEKGNPIYVIPRVRISPLPGYSQEALIHENKEVKEYVEQICRAFGFDSIFNVQLKYGEDGKPKVYEINPRISATAVANTAAGVDLLLFSILKELKITYPKNIQPKKIRMIRFWKEFYTDN